MKSCRVTWWWTSTTLGDRKAGLAAPRADESRAVGGGVSRSLIVRCMQASSRPSGESGFESVWLLQLADALAPGCWVRSSKIRWRVAELAPQPADRGPLTARLARPGQPYFRPPTRGQAAPRVGTEGHRPAGRAGARAREPSLPPESRARRPGRRSFAKPPLHGVRRRKVAARRVSGARGGFGLVAACERADAPPHELPAKANAFGRVVRRRRNRGEEEGRRQPVFDRLCRRRLA